jgi:hypothetical protein
MTLNNYEKNVIRTAVPSVVGFIISLLVKSGLDLSSDSVMVLMPCITTMYYTIIRGLEERFPKLSWLLGALPSNPIDPKSDPID